MMLLLINLNSTSCCSSSLSSPPQFFSSSSSLPKYTTLSPNSPTLPSTQFPNSSLENNQQSLVGHSSQKLDSFILDLQSIYDSFLLQTKGALFKTVDYLPFHFLAIFFPYLLPMDFFVGSLLHFPACLFRPTSIKHTILLPPLTQLTQICQKTLSQHQSTMQMPNFATLFLPLFSIFLCPILPLFSTLYISLWDAMDKLWCSPIGNEFKRWRVGINKGGGEIDGHKENSQHFRANF